MEDDRYIVEFDLDAVAELQAVRSKEERTAVFNALKKLRVLGEHLQPPHVKSLKGEPGLRELRPRRGDSKSRLIFARLGDRYLVLAVSADHANDLSKAVTSAALRLGARK